MNGLIFFAVFIAFNVMMYFEGWLTVSMIVTTIIASIWFMILIYVKLTLLKREEKNKVEFKRDFSFKTIIYIALFFLLVIRIYFNFEDIGNFHLLVYIIADRINDYCLSNYYVISDEKKYNRIILTINKLSKTFDRMSNKYLFSLVYIFIYYVINVIIF